MASREPCLEDHLKLFSDIYNRPLLSKYLDRLHARPLLWRVDHFLSGKGWPTS